MSIEIAAPEQTASGGGLGDGMEILGESVKCTVEFIRAKGSRGEVETEDNERRFEGKGRQNMVGRHHRPFQKSTKIGSGNDARGSSFWAFARDHPKLRLPVNPRRMMDKALLDANKIPRGTCPEIGEERAYVCLSDGASVPGPEGNAATGSAGGKAMVNALLVGKDLGLSTRVGGQQCQVPLVH